MIRHPIHSAVGRGRPDLARLTEGIASSLRLFSTSQSLGNESSHDSRRPFSGQRRRSADAARQLFAMSQPGSKPLGAKSEGGNGSGSGSSNTAAPEIPKIISVNSLRGGLKGRFANFRKTTDEGNDFRRPSSTSDAPRPAQVIRGGFRGRGGTFAARGGSRGGAGRGRGRGRRNDDRPSRRRRSQQSEEEREDEDAFRRFAKSYRTEDPEEAKITERVECGVAKTYNPPADILGELAGYMPALATSATPLSHGATALTQARMLGGGRPFCPDDMIDYRDAKVMYEKGEGVFFSSRKNKEATEEWLGGQVEFQSPPEETKQAVVEAALLGQYGDEPKFADAKDTLAVVRNYVKRNGTWSAGAERGIEEKVRSLLPVQKSGSGKAKPKGKRA